MTPDVVAFEQRRLRESAPSRTAQMRATVPRMNKIAFSTLLLGATLALAACDNDPGKDKAKAEVAAPVKTSTAPAAGVKYAISGADSKIEYTGAKVTGKHTGTFPTFTGTITVPDGKPEQGSVTVEIDMASVTSDDEGLTKHLKNADFFDVGKHPKAKFVSTSIKPGGEKGATHTITGNLELRGTTKSITFPATVKVTGDTADVDAEFAINRKDFGIAYAGKADDLIKDEVLLKLTIRGKKSGA